MILFKIKNVFFKRYVKLEIIADNFTVSNSLIFQKLKNRDKKFFLEFFEKIAEIADFIDINLGQLKKEIKDIVDFIFKILYEVHEFRIVLDSVNLDTIKYAVACCKDTPILNALSIDPFKIENILPIAKEYNTEIISLIMDSRVPVTLDEKIFLTLELVNQCSEYGIPCSKIIVDPVAAPLGWEKGGEYNKNNLEYLEIVKQAVSEDIRTVMGFSNITTGATGNRSVKKLDAYYLAMSYAKNIDYALVNVFDRNIIDVLNFINVIDNKRIFSAAQFNG